MEAGPQLARYVRSRSYDADIVPRTSLRQAAVLPFLLVVHGDTPDWLCQRFTPVASGSRNIPLRGTSFSGGPALHHLPPLLQLLMVNIEGCTATILQPRRSMATYNCLSGMSSRCHRRSIAWCPAATRRYLVSRVYTEKGLTCNCGTLWWDCCPRGTGSWCSYLAVDPRSYPTWSGPPAAHQQNRRQKTETSSGTAGLTIQLVMYIPPLTPIVESLITACVRISISCSSRWLMSFNLV